MGDLLFDVIEAELKERGLKSQREVIDFVRKQTGWKLTQQMVSKIANRQIKNPRESAHVMMTLIALDRDAAGKPRIVSGSTRHNETVMREAVRLVEEALEGRERPTPNGVAEVVAFCYRALTRGETPSAATILDFARFHK